MALLSAFLLANIAKHWGRIRAAFLDYPILATACLIALTAALTLVLVYACGFDFEKMLFNPW